LCPEVLTACYKLLPAKGVPPVLGLLHKQGAVGPPRIGFVQGACIHKVDVAYDEAALAVGLADTTFFHATFTEMYPVDGDFAGRLRAFLAYQARSIRGYNAFLRAARATGAGCDRLIWARIARCVVYSPLGARAAS